MKKTHQISESIGLGVVLALSGGLMDAYSYVGRGHVFANAQTGNILLFGIHISEGRWQEAVLYFFPVLAFTAGIILSETIRYRMKESRTLHWRQYCVLIEAVILFSVGFMSQRYNLLANSLTSFVCGIQVQSFRKIHGNAMATTMCIGNLRSAAQALTDYWHTRDRKTIKKALLFYGLILVFALGAVIGYKCVRLWQEKAIWLSSSLLFISFAMMFLNNQQELCNQKEAENKREG